VGGGRAVTLRRPWANARPAITAPMIITGDADGGGMLIMGGIVFAFACQSS